MTKTYYVCDNCGKGIQHANLVSHAKNRTKTIKKPNLHSATIMKNGKKLKVRLCTKCIRKADRPHKRVMSESKSVVVEKK